MPTERRCLYPECDCAVSFPTGYEPSDAAECPRCAEESEDEGMTYESDGVTDNLRHSGMVERYSTWPTITRQSVGEHCWQVYRVYCELWGELPCAETAYYIMNHDSAELVTGDPPYPFKKNNPDVAVAYQRAEIEAHRRLGVSADTMDELSDEERARVKICDLLEMHDHGLLEIEMGNAHAAAIVSRTARAAEEYAETQLGHRARVLVHQYVTQLRARHDEVMRRKNRI